MAVHVPLSNAAVLEAQLLMLSSHNILNPQNGAPITLPSQDMVLGLYYITKGKKSTEKERVRGEGKAFYSSEEIVIAYNEGSVDLHAFVKVKVNVREDDGTLNKKLIETTVGRVLFNQHVPKEVGFINSLLTKKNLREIIGDIIKITNVPKTAKFLDDIKQLGFRTAFQGGLSFNINDLIIPSIKEDVLDQAKGEVDEVWDNYNMGLITNNERYNQIVDIWSRVDTRITETLIRELSNDKQGFNSVYMMLDSGARGSKQQIKQLCGIRGLMAKPRKSGSSGSEIIENPILSNFKGGLNVLDYFISTHGARKGLADTALKTADAGYLTRRLVDVAQDVVITEEDCGTLRGIATSALKDNEEIVEPLIDRIIGRTSLHDVYSPQSDDLIVRAGDQINEDVGRAIEDAAIEIVEIRSVLTCESKRGVCVKCYGKNLATGNLTQKGDAVGIIAAQSIGEPGTQLTLRTFHVGGVAGSASV
jgi:DNA-directed RNA polymerase subunit beta'